MNRLLALVLAAVLTLAVSPARADYLLLNDGTSRVLLNNGTDKLLLNVATLTAYSGTKAAGINTAYFEAWAPAGGGESVAAYVEAAPQGGGTTRSSEDFWWDTSVSQYRGSVLRLAANKTYDLTFYVNGVAVESTTITTRKEPPSLPIAETRTLATGTLAGAHVIDGQNGTANGYIVYEPADGNDIDAKDVDFAVTIKNSSYLIFRNFKVKNARQGAFWLKKQNPSVDNSVHDIVFQGNEVWNWGRINLYTTNANPGVTAGNWLRGATSGAQARIDSLSDPAGTHPGKIVSVHTDNGTRFQDGETVNEYDSTNTTATGVSFALHLDATAGYGFGGYAADDKAFVADDGAGTNFSNLTWWRNNVRDPRGDANLWQEMRADIVACTFNGDNTNCHPHGAGGVFLENSAGGHSLIYNTFQGADTATANGDKTGRRFFDPIGGANDDTIGAFHKNTEIIGNRFEKFADDTESEGKNINVVIGENYFDDGHNMLGMAPISSGPAYVYRNVMWRGLEGWGGATGGYGGTSQGIKLDGFTLNKSFRLYFLHNTLWKGNPAANTIQQSIKSIAKLGNVVSRFNILRGRTHNYTGGNLTAAEQAIAGNDLNRDIVDRAAPATNKVGTDPGFGANNTTSTEADYSGIGYRLASTSAGYNSVGGNALRNFPDMVDHGADQTGLALLEFGHTANLTNELTAEVGSFALSGQNVAMFGSPPTLMAAQVGQFTLSGKEVTLATSGDSRPCRCVSISISIGLD